MIYLKIITLFACAFLFWLGGYSWKPARRFIMPFICALMAFLATFNVLTGVGMLLSVIPLSFGYGESSVLRHGFGNGWGRGVWGFLVAICLSLPLFLTHNLGLSFALHDLNDSTMFVSFLLFVYLALNFTLENVLKNINQKIGDPIIGAGFGLIVLLIK